jgi:hypothetical protein
MTDINADAHDCVPKVIFPRIGDLGTTQEIPGKPKIEGTTARYELLECKNAPSSRFNESSQNLLRGDPLRRHDRLAGVDQALCVLFNRSGRKRQATTL